jgi:hypothetical protein
VPRRHGPAAGSCCGRADEQIAGERSLTDTTRNPRAPVGTLLGCHRLMAPSGAGHIIEEAEVAMPESQRPLMRQPPLDALGDVLPRRHAA